MKKLMLAFAATAAFVSVSSAVTTNEWFTGTAKSESGGSWTAPTSGSVSTNDTTLVLDEVDKFTFAATTPKSVSGAQDLKFSTGAKFSYSYDALPAVDPTAKAGVVVVNNKYYVLAKDSDASPATNKWVDTTFTAALDSSVAVNVVVTNGNHALYTIGTYATLDKVVVADGAWGSVDYKGSGEIASLVGTTIEFGWPSPSGPIDVDPTWAAANGIDAAKFNSPDKLSNGFSASESYILGLNTNETLDAVCKYGFDEYLKVKISKAAKLADKVSYDVWIDGACKFQDVTFPVSCFKRVETSTERTIEVRPNVDGQTTTGKTQTVGVWSSAQVASNSIGYISIPYECAVSNALYNLFDEGHTDYMYVYDADSGEWDTWKITGTGMVWTFVQTGSRTTPITTVLHPGQAVKIFVGDCAYGTSKGFVHVGNKVDRSSTALIPNKYNLVGNPVRSATPITDLTATDKIRTFAVAENGEVSLLPDVSYAKYGAKWYKVQLNGTAEEVTEIPNDVHGFYIYPSENVIHWPSEPSVETPAEAPAETPVDSAPVGGDTDGMLEL